MLRQAHVEGKIDCSKAKLLDRNWWLKVRWTLDWVEKCNRMEVRKLRHDMNCALLNYANGRKVLDLHWKQATDLQRLNAMTLLPYEKHKSSRKELEEMTDLWKQLWGDPNDPEVAKKIQDTADALLEMSIMGNNNANTQAK